MMLEMLLETTACEGIRAQQGRRAPKASSAVTDRREQRPWCRHTAAFFVWAAPAPSPRSALALKKERMEGL